MRWLRRGPRSWAAWPHEHAPRCLDAKGTWPDETYAWFQVGDIAGGTDAYYWPVDEVNLDYWHELAEGRRKARDELIRRCLNVGHDWSFRRSAGQRAIISIAYGLIAASLAALTYGFVFSDDSAWDWDSAL